MHISGILWVSQSDATRRKEREGMEPLVVKPEDASHLLGVSRATVYLSLIHI